MLFYHVKQQDDRSLRTITFRSSKTKGHRWFEISKEKVGSSVFFLFAFNYPKTDGTVVFIFITSRYLAFSLVCILELNHKLFSETCYVNPQEFHLVVSK